VETLAHVPLILRRGAAWYREHRPTLFSVTGDVATPGVFELPLGLPVRDLIAAAGGALPGDRVAAVLPGGYSLPWLRAGQLDVAMEPAALQSAGTSLGASVIVVGERQGLGLAAAKIAAFFARETCQTCPICVTGTARLAELLRPGAARPLDAAESREITAFAAEHRGKGICTLPCACPAAPARGLTRPAGRGRHPPATPRPPARHPPRGIPSHTPAPRAASPPPHPGVHGPGGRFPVAGPWLPFRCPGGRGHDP
jgi:NADH:ubiquinone oxidoreductase subunit F (NADH-binding)